MLAGSNKESNDPGGATVYIGRARDRLLRLPDHSAAAWPSWLMWWEVSLPPHPLPPYSTFTQDSYSKPTQHLSSLPHPPHSQLQASAAACMSEAPFVQRLWNVMWNVARTVSRSVPTPAGVFSVEGLMRWLSAQSVKSGFVEISWAPPTLSPPSHSSPLPSPSCRSATQTFAAKPVR